MKRIIHSLGIALASVLLCGCASATFVKHSGPPRVEINTAGVVFVGTDRTKVPIRDVPAYLRAQCVPKGNQVGLSHSGATDPAVVKQIWEAIADAGWKQGLTIVK